MNEGDSGHGSTLKDGLANQKQKLALKCLDEDHVGADDSRMGKKTNPAKKILRRLTKAASSVVDEGNLVVRESVRNSFPAKKLNTKKMQGSVERRSSRIKKIQSKKATSLEDKVEKEDLVGAKADGEIPADQKSPRCLLRSSVKSMINQLKLVKDDVSISEAQKPANVEPITGTQPAEEEEMQTETTQKKMRPQPKTYGGPKKRNATQPQEVSNHKVKSPVVVLEKYVEGKQVRSSSGYTKDLLAFWTDPVLVHKNSSSPVGMLPENARQVLSFSGKDQVKPKADQDHDVRESSGVKGILKTAHVPGRKKMVRFSDPMM
jgi:hypothetical protein